MSTPKNENDGTGGVSATITSGMARAVSAAPRTVTDPTVHARESLFREAVHQARPLAVADTGLAERTLALVRGGNARHPRLSEGTARRMVTTGRKLADLTRGHHAAATPAEVVVAHDYKVQHAGGDAGIVAPAPHAPNVIDVRIAADAQARRDILFLIEDPKRGLRFYKEGGQVKTGSGRYVSKTLQALPGAPGYGQTAYVDSKFVNRDGSPRVAPDAFTPGQAHKLEEAGVRLRGICDLHGRSEQLVKDLTAQGRDGMSPEARARLLQLRDDIARLYQGRAMAGRVAGGAAAAAAAAALVSLLVQRASGGEVELIDVRDAAAHGALVGAGGALADAGLYHLASQLGAAPEVARVVAQNGVAAGFCLLAVGADVWDEVSAARRGEISNKGALAGAGAKIALDLLPLALAPLGLVGYLSSSSFSSVDDG